MDVKLHKNLMVARGEEFSGSADWLGAHDGHVFKLRAIPGGALFHGLGEEDEARRTPINITSRAPGLFRLISNFAHTPFVLDSLAYASVEAFWQGLKFPDKAKRCEIASLYGAAAKDAGFRAPASDVIAHNDTVIRVGTWDHWQLMRRACEAKFEQHADARAALVSTGGRPLVHQMRRDSRTIPGVIMAEIWMGCRARLRAARPDQNSLPTRKSVAPEPPPPTNLEHAGAPSALGAPQRARGDGSPDEI
jgi:predicted NAD-dependent protein-ADP-ribosyltransferase YbiA (DUF1768 family)